MPALDTRLYKELIKSLHKMSEGINELEEDLSAVIDEEILRSAINRINFLKFVFEDSELRTRKFYHLYLQEIEKTRKEFARIKIILYNHFGKTNKKMEKFGLKVYK